MNNENQVLTLGIDIGSTTVKTAVLDSSHQVLFYILKPGDGPSALSLE